MILKNWFLMKYHKLLANLSWKYTDRWEFHKNQYKKYNNKYFELVFTKSKRKIN